MDDERRDGTGHLDGESARRRDPTMNDDSTDPDGPPSDDRSGSDGSDGPPSDDRSGSDGSDGPPSDDRSGSDGSAGPESPAADGSGDGSAGSDRPAGDGADDDSSGTVESGAGAGGSTAESRDTIEGGVLPMTWPERPVTILLLLVLVAALGGVVYVAVTPQETAEPYTEFYVLGPDGNASGYPTSLGAGETGEFVVGLSNHEHAAMDYAVVVRTDDRALANYSVRVPDDSTREERVTFSLADPGEYRLRILLYKGGTVEGSPDDFLRLWVEVSAA